ncbi:O-antigen ligase family protein [Candidatus Uhrbacteria bacterium]|nr:O-antigen ligase family protein [Candidatus Uhrbacteria bacterium]
MTLIISTIVSPDLRAALGSLKAFFIEPIVFVALALPMLDERDRKTAFLSLLGGGMFVALTGIAQYVFDAGIPAPWDVERRVTGVFPYPNALGLYLAPLITIGVASLAQKIEWTRRQRVFIIKAVILSTIAIVLSQTEAAWVSIPAALLFGWFINGSRRVRIILGSVVIISLILTFQPFLALPGPLSGGAGSGFAGQPFLQKLTLQDPSGHTRLVQWHETAAFLKDHWFLGAGLSGYPTVIQPYHLALEQEIFQDPHNIILNVWVEMGLVGLLMVGLLVVMIAKAAWKRRADPIGVSSFLALVQIAIHGLVDVPYFKNDLSVLTVFLVGLILIPSHVQDKSPHLFSFLRSAARYVVSLGRRIFAS